ncbi:MAG: hypothetical protein ACN0LA_08780 [Candidatus Longimicrobiales bacterium M2_2A_002]
MPNRAASPAASSSLNGFSYAHVSIHPCVTAFSRAGTSLCAGYIMT